MVFCYRNLNRKGVVWSVKSTKTGLVIDRSSTVYLSNCQFKVSEAGRSRVLKNQRKNVHAGATGTRIKTHPKNVTWVQVYYDPYTAGFFWYEAMGGINPVWKCDYIKLTKNGCFAGYKAM